jgi:hypothetical protein
VEFLFGRRGGGFGFLTQSLLTIRAEPQGVRHVVLALVLAGLLLSGCTAAPVAHPPLSAKAETRQVPESQMYPGIVVRGTLGVNGDRLAVSAVARNEGSRTFQVEAGCSHPWGEVLFHSNDTIQMRVPTAQCDAFALTDFAPGDELPFDVSWDGRVWDEDAHRLVSAEPGQYTWSLRFVAYQPDGTSAKRFDLDFEVTVLPG